MIGGEHKKERFSERLAGAQNQPKNRGYLPGTAPMTGGYTSTTLEGNWFEERSDAGYYDGKAVLPTSREKYWTTTYRELTSDAARRAKKEEAQFDQTTLMEIVDHTKSSYPGHQPHVDPQQAATLKSTFTTTSRETYRPPSLMSAGAAGSVSGSTGCGSAALRRSTVVSAAMGSAQKPITTCAVVGGGGGAGGAAAIQASAVLARLRRQLFTRLPGLSAFPGNVARTVRHALRACSTAAAHDRVNVQELEEGLVNAGLDVTAVECTALVRYFDRIGDGSAPVEDVVCALRGEWSEHREQLCKRLYAFLETVCEDHVVRLRQLADLVDVHELESVKEGLASPEEARESFAAQWDLPTDDAFIRLDTFLLFFADASSEIAEERVFEKWLRNTWHLSGGAGKSANTSCRRVRVVHRNGRVTTAEVVNDLTIRAGDGVDVDAMILANLVQQGMKDVKSFEVLPRDAMA